MTIKQFEFKGDAVSIVMGLLTVLFAYFKLDGRLDWSWWWVFSPLWLPFVIILGIIAVVGAFVFLFAVIKELVK